MNVTRREIELALLTVGAGCIAVSVVTGPRREQMRRSTCTSNLSALGWAFQQYAQDYDSTLPRPWFGRDAGPSDARVNYKWMDAIFPYVKNSARFTCPNDSVSLPYRERDGRSYGSYVMNNAYFAPGDAQSPPGGRRLDGSWNASVTALLVDGENDFQFSWPDAARTPPIVGDNPFHWDSIRGRHGAGVSASFGSVGCDGTNMTNLQALAYETHIVNGHKIYINLTTEAD